MDKNTKLQIEKLLSILTPQQLKESILELKDTNENKEIIDFLEKIGLIQVTYENQSDFPLNGFQEKSGVTNLWYKKPDETWVIKLYQIIRML